MPRVQVSISLPYLLKLSSGLYQVKVGPQYRELEINEPAPVLLSSRGTFTGESGMVVGQATMPPLQRKTIVSIVDNQPETDNPEEQARLNGRQAHQLLSLTNSLLRCYRAMTRNSDITELSRAEASPFRFRVLAEADEAHAWEEELSFESSPPKVLSEPSETITERVRALLASGSEPEVADLFLLDAERATHEGRFREAVLFCWSTIDSTFNREYDKLVDSKLDNEWAEAREFFKGVDFPLKKKMSAALYLVSGRSLFREPGDLWQRLSSSYNKRNGIIHRGESATEDDARRALEVALNVVKIMSTL